MRQGARRAGTPEAPRLRVGGVNWLAILEDDCAAVLGEAWRRSKTRVIDNFEYGLVLAAAAALVYRRFDHNRGGVLELVAAPAIAFVGVSLFFFVADLPVAVGRLRRVRSKLVGERLPADGKMVAGIEVVGLRGRVFLILDLGREARPDGIVVCEFYFIGRPGDPVHVWKGSAERRFETGDDRVVLEYPTDFGTEAPQPVPPSGPHAVNWKRGDKILGRCKFWLILTPTS
jgi:hypothetical protein